jgi:hypothetical protein
VIHNLEELTLQNVVAQLVPMKITTVSVESVPLNVSLVPEMLITVPNVTPIT